MNIQKLNNVSFQKKSEVVFIVVAEERWRNDCHPLVLSGHISVSSPPSSVYMRVVAKEDGEEEIMLSGTLGGSSLKLKWAWITQLAISAETALRLILPSCSSEKDNTGACFRFKCLLLCDWQRLLFTVSVKLTCFCLKIWVNITTVYSCSLSQPVLMVLMDIPSARVVLLACLGVGFFLFLI